MQALINSRIGVDVFKSRIDRLKSSKYLNPPVPFMNVFAFYTFRSTI